MHGKKRKKELQYSPSFQHVEIMNSMRDHLRSFALCSIVGLVRIVMGAYDVVTYPLCLLIYRPWRFREKRDRMRARIVHRYSVILEGLRQ